MMGSPQAAALWCGHSAAGERKIKTGQVRPHTTNVGSAAALKRPRGQSYTSLTVS